MDSFSWRVQPFSWDLAQRFAEDLGVPLILGMVLARRSFRTVAEARAFLAVDDLVPDPFLFADMQAAVERLSAAVDSQRRVVVHGDYDVDGISATALLLRGLQQLGLDAEAYLPSRFRHGYGLTRQGIEEIAARGAALVLTVDCGVAYPDEVAYAASLGLDVVVTDHHQPGERLPECPVIHPAVGDYPHASLCGVGVALKLLHALYIARRGAARERLPEALQENLDLVALGTVADLVPLVGENRYYVKEGLVRLAGARKVGLRELIRVAQTEGRLDTTAIGFRLAPRLNAGGRLEDAEVPLRLLLTEDEAEARRLAEELDQLNKRRQEVEGRIFSEAAAEVERLPELPAALVLAGEGWHEGVVGIVASRLVERFRRPTVLLNLHDGFAKGSGRSIPAFDLIAGVRTCADLLLKHGGHHQAVGLTLHREDLPAFTARFVAHADSALSAEDFVPTFFADAIVSGQDITLETADALARLAPFGVGNRRVRLLALGAEVSDPQATRSGGHLRCSLVVDGVRTKGIGFGLARTIPALEEDACCHAGLHLQASEWQGFSRAEVELHSLYRPRDLGQTSLGCTPDCPFLDELGQAAPCPHCADPYAEETVPLPLRGRDLRDRGGYLSAIAQVLSSGEPVCVVGVSVPHRLAAVTSRLPLLELGVPGVDCVSRACWRTRFDGLRPEALLFVDWTAAQRRAALLHAKRHLIVVDPPFRASQTALLDDLARNGVRVHLAYGAAERDFTAGLLQLLLHPRPWMVALYRAWQRDLRGEEAYREVVRVAYAEHRMLPTGEDLQRAEVLLGQLGISAGESRGATIEAEQLPAYAAQVAAYEEAVQLCRNL